MMPVSTPLKDKKAPPNFEIIGILSRLLRDKSSVKPDEIDQVVRDRRINSLAKQLLEVADCPEDYWTMYRAAAVDIKNLRDWQPLVEKHKPDVEKPDQDQDQTEEFQFLEFRELRNLPKPEWLVYDMLPTKGISFLYGPPKTGKTYAAVGIAGSIASSSVNWMDRVTKHGHVVYIAAEDIDEVAQRFIAYADVNGLDDIPNLHCFPCPLALAKDTPRFMTALDKKYPDVDIALFVVDTLAMCSLGVDENAKKDFDAVIGSLEILWRKYNCCVVVVHHSGKNGEMRGTSSMDGVAYSMIEVTAVDDNVVLKSKAKRRGKPFDDIYLDRRIVETGDLDEMGLPATTCVLVKSDRKTSDESTPGKLGKLQREILQHIKNLGGKEVARTEVMKACQVDRNHETGFCNSASGLLQKGYITLFTEKKRTFYTLTEAAIELLQSQEV